MRWKQSKFGMPPLGTFIAAIRRPWPSFYWIGHYMGVPSADEDMFDEWIELPEVQQDGVQCHVCGCRRLKLSCQDCGRVLCTSEQEAGPRGVNEL